MEKRDILLLFYRPWEPIFYPKGEGADRCIFEIPADFLTDEFKKKASIVLNKFNIEECRRIELSPHIKKNVYKIDLSKVNVCSRQEVFLAHSMQHMAAATSLIDLFLACKSYEDLIVTAVYCHDRVNVELYAYALSVVIAHSDDLKLFVPLSWQVFPRYFVEPKLIQKAIDNASIFANPSERDPIEIPLDYTGTDGDPEHRVAYWREDIGVNNYHWHWHLIYPTFGPINISKKDRRGEFFYYIHHQILARFNAERLSNHLNLSKRLIDWHKPIDLAYYPKLDTTVASQRWASRPAGLTFKSLKGNGEYTDVNDMERYRNRVYNAMHSKIAIASDGEKIELDDVTGIDLLANMVESNILSVNLDFYGGIHRIGHFLIARIHDPEGHYLEAPGVMGNTLTAMRDPIFYQWHGYLNDLFIEFKSSLTPYTEEQLNFSGIEVSEISVCKLNLTDQCDGELNRLETFWQKTDLDLSRGLDFASPGPISVRYTHLNHTDFVYNIDINNTSGSEKHGMVRIYMAPVYSSDGYPLKLEDQRHLMMEMDKFVVFLQPGTNKISRKSTESSLTIPFEQTFRDLNEGRPPASDPEELDKFNFCGCGWPQHLLLTKGTASGFSMRLFVMVSDYENDKVEQDHPTTGCKTGISFCGLKNLKFPDKQSMGYPFDRKPRSDVSNLDDFLTPNMKTIAITIIHLNEVKQPQHSNDRRN